MSILPFKKHTIAVKDAVIMMFHYNTIEVPLC